MQRVSDREMPSKYDEIKKLAILPLIAFCSTAIAQQDTTSIADSLLIEQIQREMAQPRQEGVLVAGPRTPPTTNPSISAIGDFRASYLSPARRHFDAELHEAEFALKSVVDPYARADFFLSVVPDPESGECGMELEEVYLVTLALPANLQLKAGKFRSSFGRINPIHPHALPFVDSPNAYENYLGDEGLNDVGFSLSWLVPNPLDFYQEFTFEITRGPDESMSFVKSDVDRFLYLGHLKNFWDLTDNATLEVGLTGVLGPNEFARSSLLGGIDITYKWKPLRFGTYRSFVVQGEAILSNKKISGDETINSWGMYVLATYQLEQRLFLTGRFDYSNIPDNSLFVERAYSGTLGWLATEFQKLELEFKTTSSNSYSNINQVLLRSVFVIGTHGAHVY